MSWLPPVTKPSSPSRKITTSRRKKPPKLRKTGTWYLTASRSWLRIDETASLWRKCCCVQHVGLSLTDGFQFFVGCFFARPGEKTTHKKKKVPRCRRLEQHER